MRLAGLPRLLERHAVAAGFGASVAVHAAIAAGLAWSAAGERIPGVARTTQATTVLLARELPSAAPTAAPVAEPRPEPSREASHEASHEPSHEASREARGIADEREPATSAGAAAARRFTARSLVERLDRAARSAAVELSSEVARRVGRIGGALRPILARAASARPDLSPDDATAAPPASADHRA